MASFSLEPKAWTGDGADLKDSNMALVGSELDKIARKSAAEKEAAWVSCGKAPGIEVWRIENFQVKSWPRERHGAFHTGDSYIVLKTTKVESKLTWDIHFWLGSTTTQDEMGTAAYKTVELDDYFDQAAIQHRETQGHESLQFTKLFKEITYLEGGVDSGFHHVEGGTQIKKLFRVRKTKHTVRVAEVPCIRKSLNQGDCFLLDLGDALYPWFGEDASPFERAKCGTRAHNVAISRHGKCAVKEAPDAAFWAALGGEGPIAPASEAPAPEKEDVGEGVLYKLSDASGSLTCSEAKRGDIKVTDLDSNDVFILDAGREIFVWVGSKASDAERRNAMPTAQAYLHANNKPIHTAVHCVNEGTPFTNEVWKAIMK
jgi:gelsolin